ncbi:uncharacterized protein V6R79_010975 [Siganus canaliculatus]
MDRVPSTCRPQSGLGQASWLQHVDSKKPETTHLRPGAERKQTPEAADWQTRLPTLVPGCSGRCGRAAVASGPCTDP